MPAKAPHIICESAHAVTVRHAGNKGTTHGTIGALTMGNDATETPASNAIVKRQQKSSATRINDRRRTRGATRRATHRNSSFSERVKGVTRRYTTRIVAR